MPEETEVNLGSWWSSLSEDERTAAFGQLPEDDAEELFLSLSTLSQADLISSLPSARCRPLVRLLAPDDAVDLIQELPEEQREDAISMLDRLTRREVRDLLAYAEDEAGGLMSPRFVRVLPDMRITEAFLYLRKQAKRSNETVFYIYVLDNEQRLLGVISLRELLAADNLAFVRDVMVTDLVTVNEDTKQEEVSALLAQYNLLAIPVLGKDGSLKGIVTVDDVMDVMQEEVTEDIQKIGGTQAFDEPYLGIGAFGMLRKRVGWLAVLFIGEMLTATAMAYYEHEIARALVLALFIPLIISSGGNAGSQASTLVIRALAVGEVRSRNWARVFAREAAVGAALGIVLGIIAYLRITAWPNSEIIYGTHYALIGLTVASSLVGVVLWGTITGSMLPLLLQRLGFDPATASAPFVATLADVTGLVIYFSIANVILSGVLL